MKKFKCFSKSMAAFLSDDQEFPINKQYYSEVYDAYIYEFIWSEALQEAINLYLKRYNEWKQSQNKQQ